MRSRPLAAALATLVTLPLMLLTGRPPRVLAASARPNVLLILTDDQRPWGTLGALPTVATRIRDRGVRFTQAFATTPLCCPSRSSMLTGLYAHNDGVPNNDQPLEALQRVDSMTIADALQADGYTTGMFGKYLNAWPNAVSPSGFDQWAITPYVTYTPADWDVNGTVQTVDTYPTRFVRRRSMDFVDWASSQGKPWFAYVAPMAPHLPATPAPAFADMPVGPFPVDAAMQEQDRSDKPPYVQDQTPWPLSKWSSRRAAQLRSLASVDRMVSALLDELRSLHELHDTLVIFASDNGMTWGEHGLHVGGKSVPYLPSVRVPLFMRWSGHTDPGSVDHRLVALLDLAPTILDATGTPLPHPMDGIDLLQGGVVRSGLLLEYSTGPGVVVPSWAAIVSPAAEYVEYYDDTGNLTFPEYYDRVHDPQQLTNLLGDGDPTNDPDTGVLSVQLAVVRTCAGADCVV